MTEAPQTDVGRRCLECDYNLTAITTSRCPECGWVIDWDLVDSVQTSKRYKPEESVAAALALGVGVSSALASGIQLWVSPSNQMRFHDIFYWPTLLSAAGHGIALLGLVPRGLRFPSASTRVRVMLTLAILQIVAGAIVAVDLTAAGGLVRYRLAALAPGTTLLLILALTGRNMRQRELVRDAIARQSRIRRDKQADDNL